MKLETQMNVASNLRTLRKSKGLSQGEIAKLIDGSRSLYTHYELGNRTQDAEALYIISREFNINMAVLFENDPRKFLSHLANDTTQDTGLEKLIPLYKQLSSFSAGMLVERALWLLSKERENLQSR